MRFYLSLQSMSLLVLLSCGGGGDPGTGTTTDTDDKSPTSGVDTAGDTATTDTGTPTSVPADGVWIEVASDAIPSGQDTYDLAITDSGDFYIVYGRESDQELWAMHSSDGGTTWSAAAQVTQGETWSHSLRDKPYIISNDQDVHVVFQEVVQGGFPSVLMPRWYSATAGANLAFTGPSTVPIDAANNWNHFPQLGFRSDGELWLTWISFGLSFNKEGYFARESNGFTPELLPSSQTPCDCCQAHLMTTSAGDLMYAWRSEYQNYAGLVMRDPVVFIARDGDDFFSEEVKTSTSNWQIDACPQQGVRLAEAGGVVYAVWADTTDGAYKVWFAQSTDGGSTWIPEVAIAPNLGTHDSPNVAADDLGGVWVVLDERGPTYLVHRPSGAATFDPPVRLINPNGSEMLDPIVASNGGKTAVIAQDSIAGTLWLYLP